MTAFTITTDTNFEALTGAVGASDTYAINGAVLTIDTDTRYCTNHNTTTGELGTITLSSTLKNSKLMIDGRGVRLIPYNTGSGNVPAIGTTITEGGVSAYLLGVWSALNAAPTAAGNAMPVSGYIKVKNKTGGDFSAGALTGIGANATGADTVGWIEVPSSAINHSLPATGTVEVKGSWFSAGSTSGARNQTIQLPASLALTHYGGVWIETAPGSGLFDFWPNAGSFTNASMSTDERGKFVWISSQGLLRIGHDGTNAVGLLPESGRAIRVPNVILLSGNGAGANALAVTPSSRPRFTTMTGVMDMDTVVNNWSATHTSSARSISYVRCALLEQVNVQNTVGQVTLADGGVGQSAAVNVTPLTLQKLLTPVAVTDWVFSHGVQLVNSALTSLLVGGNFTRTRFVNLGSATNAIACVTLDQCSSLTFDDCTFISTHGISCITACTDLRLINSHYAYHVFGTTGTATSTFVLFNNYSEGLFVDGLDFMGLTNVHPFTGIIDYTKSVDVTLRNLGSYDSKLSLGSANPTTYALRATTSVNRKLRIQRVYVSNTGTALLFPQTDSDIQFINVFGDAANGNFDKRTYFKGFVREYGKKYKDSVLSDTGKTATGAYIVNLLLSNEDDIKITANDAAMSGAPYSGITVTYYGTDQMRSIAGGSYPYRIIVAGNGATLEQIYTKLQYLLRQNSDIDSGAGTVIGKTADAFGSFTGDSFVTATGVFFDNFDANDTNRVTMTDKDGVARLFPYVAAGTITSNSFLTAGGTGYYRLFFTTNPAGDWGTATAVTVKDNNGVDIQGTLSSGAISFTFDYDGNVQGGRTAGVDAAVTLVAGNAGSAKPVVATGTLSRSKGIVLALVAEQDRSYS